MSVYFLRLFSGLLWGTLLLGVAACTGATDSVKTVSAKSDARSESVISVSSPMPQSTAAENAQTAYFAGGCFWGVEAVFEHIKGVSDVTSGFARGKPPADSETSDENKYGHAETVKVIYDPSVVTYEQLLKIFFLTAHDPTELNRQGPDVGIEYRSVIFYTNAEQRRLAENYIAELSGAKTFAQPIVTHIVALDRFKQAPDEHQNYMARNPDSEYIVANDKPKLENLRRQFPDLYISK